jgi:hypothetical protein
LILAERATNAGSAAPSEQRLGRTLAANDFTDSPVNDLNKKERMSARMRERLTAVDALKPKRKRGRPKGSKNNEQPKRKRGRPKGSKNHPGQFTA